MSHAGLATSKEIGRPTRFPSGACTRRGRPLGATHLRFEVNMPAKQARASFDYPDFAEYELRHNPGYDFLRMLDWCVKADATAFDAIFPAYARSPIAILLAGAAIEGYLNYAGHALVPDWEHCVRTAKTFSQKLKRIFTAREKTVVLDSGVYQRAIALVTFRGSLAHPRFTHTVEARESPPPTQFDHVEADYPATRVLEIATSFRDSFLADVGLDDLWWRQHYAEIPRPTSKPSLNFAGSTNHRGTSKRRKRLVDQRSDAMFDAITEDRLLKMTDQERRWLSNVKRALFDSDQALLSGKPQNRCMEDLCKGIDVAKTLRRSLRGEDISTKDNKARFLEFVYLDVPPPKGGKNEIPLLDARTKQVEMYSFAELLYAVRCMAIHENDNLDAAVQSHYHIRLDWNMRAPEQWLGIIENGNVTVNARTVSHRLREVLAKFITGIDGIISATEGRGFTITGNPPLGSIRPS
jgi:hypothetical protein